MADGTGGVSSGRAASSREVLASDDAERRLATPPDVARKHADREASARADRYFATPSEQRWLKSQAVANEAAERRTTTEKTRIDALVRGSSQPTSLGELTSEILRLKGLARTAGADTALRDAVGARLGSLVDAWCTKARASGMAPPRTTFEPYLASDRDLGNAFLWCEVAGTIPVDAAMHDGGLRFREDVFEAIALRTPGLDEQVLASYDGDPGTKRLLLEGELRRLGDKNGCRGDETLEALTLRRGELLHGLKPSEPSNVRYMGLDGMQGTFEALVDYELEQRVLAMNPGTALGAAAASVSAVHGGSTEAIRAAGNAGNMVEGVGQGLAGVDSRSVGKRLEADKISGRRRPPPGPGLGRRTHVSSEAARPRAAGASAVAAPSRRTPTSVDDKHIFNGEVKYRSNGAPYAGGFHHQGPGTESNARLVAGTTTKPNALGVYESRVQIKDPKTGEWVEKGPESTFFPKEWTRSQVRDAILGAYAVREELPGGVWRGKLPNGMTVQGYVDASGRITSAFPEM